MATIDDSHLRETFGRFRVLIMGRANAGKTTILQKICDTTDHPEIYNAEGNKIDTAIVRSSIKRGNHDVTHGMVFKSNPSFVFHDSCGFEAGSTQEFNDIKNFITERANAKELKERIHVIWYCIPMDDPWRTFQRAEERFFLECDTGHVPVVVIFTKFEALRPFAFGQIKKEIKGLSAEERSNRIAQSAEELFTNTGVLDRLYDLRNRIRPKSHVRLERMNAPNTNCNILLEHTTLVLDIEDLQWYFSSQQVDLEFCIKGAVGTLVDCARSQFHYKLDQFDIAKWFPHVKQYEERDLRERWHDIERSRLRRCQRLWLDNNEDHNIFNAATISKDTIIHVLQPLVAKGSLFTAANRIIQTGIATIIVLDYSTFLPPKHDLEQIESAVDYYLQSPTAIAVEKGAKEISCQGYKKEELEKKIVEFILEHRILKALTTTK